MSDRPGDAIRERTQIFKDAAEDARRNALAKAREKAKTRAIMIASKTGRKVVVVDGGLR